MKKKLVPLVFLLVVAGLMCTLACANMRMVFDSEGVVGQIKKDALEREQLMEKHMFVHEAIIFGLNEANLSLKAQSVLKKKAEWLMAHFNSNVIIEGHCDSLGDDAYNLVLGKKRGQAVKTFMVGCGINESRMSLTSLGESDPVDSGKTEEELVKNRRVVFRLAN